MKVSLIVAVAENGVIGKDNDLIWHLPKDIRFFKEITMGHHVIMGRRNFESIPHKYRPLPNRTNIIITRQSEYKAEGCIVVDSVEAALEIAKNNMETLFISGEDYFYPQPEVNGKTNFKVIFQVKNFYLVRRTAAAASSNNNIGIILRVSVLMRRIFSHPVHILRCNTL